MTFLERTDDDQLRHPSFQGLHPEQTPIPAPGGASEPVPAPSPPAAPALSKRPRRTPSGLRSSVSVAGIPISDPERPIYPELHFTKRDLAEFYLGVASWMLPYVANRPLTLVRCERGIRSAEGLRRDCRFLPHDPGWYGWAAPPLRRIQIAEQRKVGEYLLVDSPEAYHVTSL